jgi:hypothetical protein
MRSSFRLGVILAVMLVTAVLAGARIQAWNPATHIYIAKNVYPAYAGQPALWYGAIAPDMAMYVVPSPQPWNSSFWDTHWTATDLRLWATTTYERVFAKGWVTHAESRAADHFAHGYPPLYLAGYVTLRARILADLSPVPISTDIAHYAIETGIDILMQQKHPELAGELLAAIPMQPAVAGGLLKRVFVWWPLQRTTVQTLYATEGYFDQVVWQYAGALAAWNVTHVPMQQLGQAVAAQAGVIISTDDVEALLQGAMAMCEPDIDLAIGLTIKGVSLSVPR